MNGTIFAAGSTIRSTTSALGLLAFALTACAANVANPGDSASTTAADTVADGSVCQTIFAPVASDLPRGSATDAKAQPIITALDAIFAASTPPFTHCTDYTLASITCTLSTVSGPPCAIVTGGSAPARTLRVDDLTLATALSNALTAVGATCAGKPKLVDVHMTPASVEYSDIANFKVEAPPNVVVTGQEALDIVQAFELAGVSDCNATKRVIISAGWSSAGLWPTNARTDFHAVDRTSTNEVVPVCGPPIRFKSAGVTLGAQEADVLTRALLAAAAKVGYTPIDQMGHTSPDYTLAQASTLSASGFSWDGTTLGLTFEAHIPAPAP